MTDADVPEQHSVDFETLPRPLIALDDTEISTPEQWEQLRRPEIMALFEKCQFGVTPSEAIEARYEIIEKDVPGLAGLSRRTQIRIHFPGYPDGPVIRVLLNVPSVAKDPVPTLLYLTFSPIVLMVDDEGLDEGMAWSAKTKARVPDREATKVGSFDTTHFVRHGYGVAMVYYGDIEPDFDHGGTFGVRSMFTSNDKPSPDEWGSLGAWAWGLSRVMDYLQTDPVVDRTRIAVAGASRLGKTMLWAAAQDTRFAMAIPLIAGQGGDSLSRSHAGETIADITDPARYHYWFAPNYAGYANSVAELPVDAHMLLALIAPRPLLQIVGADDTWSDPWGEWQAALAAAPVYELYGLQGPAPQALPPVDTLVGADMGFARHDGGHAVLPADYTIMTEFMDRHFR